MKARKYLCLLLAVLLLMLSGCNRGGNQSVEVLRNDKYAIRQNDEGFFLAFHDDAYETEYRKQVTQNSGTSGLLAYVASPIVFYTVASMKEAIKTGDFTEEQLVRMHYFERIGDRKVAVCDPNNLYEAKLPEGMNLKSINWYGKNYALVFSADDRVTNYGSFHLSTKEYCEKEIRKLKQTTETVVSESVDPQTNGTVTCYKYDGLKKKIVYTYTEGENTVTVGEMYREEDGFEVPNRIVFYGNCGNQYFYGSVQGLKERPSYEWIKSFGLMPFAGNGAA